MTKVIPVIEAQYSDSMAIKICQHEGRSSSTTKARESTVSSLGNDTPRWCISIGSIQLEYPIRAPYVNVDVDIGVEDCPYWVRMSGDTKFAEKIIWLNTKEPDDTKVFQALREMAIGFITKQPEGVATMLQLAFSRGLRCGRDGLRREIRELLGN